MLIKSIKWRLQAWHGLLLLCVLGTFGVTAYQLQRANQLRHVDQELQQRVNMIITEMRANRAAARARAGRPPARPPQDIDPEESSIPSSRRGRPDYLPPPDFHLATEVAKLFDGAGANALYFVVWLRDGTELKRSSTALDSVPLPPRTATIAETPSRQRGVLREVYHFTPPGECILVGRSMAGELAELRRLAWFLAGAGVLVLVLGLGGGWWMATRAMQPVEEISAIASRISAGNLSERIDVAGTEDELGRLAGVLNSTFVRLEAAFARQQQFTADASHELRTPISVILSQTQSALARERPPGEYREALAACQRAAQRMRQLTHSLLTLARLDAHSPALTRVPCDLARAAAEGVDLVRALAIERGITLFTDLHPAECRCDAERLAQVITNLLTNAIEHNREGGDVRIATCLENGNAVLTVNDSGPGIPPEHLPHVFDRFYRADAARSSSRGHVGLGLAISKAIVEAHGGTIEVSSQLGAGATFRVRLPRDGSQRSGACG
jgi:heavy metal sensor kinase